MKNDRGLLRATAVTRGWNRYRNKSHRKLTLDNSFLPSGTRTRDLSTTSPLAESGCADDVMLTVATNTRVLPKPTWNYLFGAKSEIV